jgi:hypothetical protein
MGGTVAETSFIGLLHTPGCLDHPIQATDVASIPQSRR